MRKYCDHIITFIVGIGITLVIWYYRGLFSARNVKETMGILSDGFFVTGILFTCFGLLIVISNIGNFDMLAYGLQNIINIFRSNKNKDKIGKTFYEYRINRSEKQKNVSFILHVGILFLVLATVFTSVYYKLS